jgi:hypothetical protein
VPARKGCKPGTCFPLKKSNTGKLGENMPNINKKKLKVMFKALLVYPATQNHIP